MVKLNLKFEGRESEEISITFFDKNLMLINVNEVKHRIIPASIVNLIIINNIEISIRGLTHITCKACEIELNHDKTVMRIKIIN